MGHYSIKELERLSGIKAHTLRIWEKRYNLFEPDRTSTNIRTYSDYDLRKLLSVRLLSNTGVKISKIVSLKEDEINRLVREIEDKELLNQKRIDDLVFPMFNYDEERFDELFDSYVEEIGIEKTFEDIIYPFLEKVGLLWLTDEINPAQEHFMTNLIRSKLLMALGKLPNVPEDSQKAILFLPEGEYHELGLLFFSFLYKKKGIRVYYLGQSVPSEEVAAAAENVNPDIILFYSIILAKKEIQVLLNNLSSLKASKIYFIENKYQTSYGLDYPKSVSRITDYKDLFV